jgi:hypothetical protein
LENQARADPEKEEAATMGGWDMDLERIETMVVGGGQAGLATGWHLAGGGRASGGPLR